MNSKYAEWAGKIFTFAMGVFVLPLAGWVWSTNILVAQLQNDLGDAEVTIASLEDQIEEAESNARAIISIEKDIEYMKSSLERIETLVTER